MRSVIVALAILITIIIMIVTANIYAAVSGEKILNNIIELETAIETADWERAAMYCDEVEKLWKKSMPKYEVMYEHEEIHLLQTSFARLRKKIELEMQNEAIIEVSVAKMFMEHLPKKDRLTLNNVF